MKGLSYTDNLTAVVGWIKSTLEVSEGDIGVAVMVDLVKGEVLPTLLRFSYMEITGSATSMVLSSSCKQHVPHTVHVCNIHKHPLLLQNVFRRY